MSEENGEFNMPLTLFGNGRFGKDENTPYNEFLQDGISNQVEGGLSWNAVMR